MSFTDDYKDKELAAVTAAVLAGDLAEAMRRVQGSMYVRNWDTREALVATEKVSLEAACLIADYLHGRDCRAALNAIWSLEPVGPVEVGVRA